MWDSPRLRNFPNLCFFSQDMLGVAWRFNSKPLEYSFRDVTSNELPLRMDRYGSYSPLSTGGLLVASFSRMPEGSMMTVIAPVSKVLPEW